MYYPSEDEFVNLSVPLGFERSKDFTVEDMIFENGGILLGTTDGLLRIKLGTEKVEEKLERIDLRKVAKEESIKAIAQSSNGNLWISTASGLVVYNSEQSLLFDNTSGLPSNNLIYRGLQFDEQNNLQDCIKAGTSNRALDVAGNAGDTITVGPICFSGCDAVCPAVLDPVNVTFQVDMTNEFVS